MALDRLTQITSSGISSTSTITVSAVAGVVTATRLTISSGANFSGVVTATNFSGNITGNLSGNVTGNINSTGVSTITTLSATSIVGVTTAGITTAYIGSVNNGPISGSKNRIINGDFEIWQRGTSVTYLDGSTNFYLADRWSGTAEYQNARHQRVSIADTASGMVTRYALRASSSTTAQVAGGTRITVGQKIENVNMYDLRGKTITASFWVKFSAATVSSSTATAYGNWNAYFGFPTSVDASFQTTTPITAVGTLQLANGALPTTWTKYSITAAVSSNAGNIDLRFQFDNLGSTASADTVWYDITQVQLEEGPVASVFERRSFGQELVLCQRYYYRVRSNNDHTIGVGYNQNTSATRHMIFFPVTMRVQPSALEQSGTAADYSIYHGTSLTVCNAVPFFTNCTTHCAEVQAGASGLTAGQGSLLSMESTGYLGWSAEL